MEIIFLNPYKDWKYKHMTRKRYVKLFMAYWGCGRIEAEKNAKYLRDNGIPYCVDWEAMYEREEWFDWEVTLPYSK